MLPTSIAGSIRIGGAADGVAGHDRADVDGLVGEVAAGLDPAQVRVGLVGAGDVGPGAVGGHRGVEQDRQLGADRADVARRARCAARSRRRGRRGTAGPGRSGA